jgi:uncharacterized damage-inducible protein DinB
MRSDEARLLAEYNAWMNGKLYAACAGLSDDERKRDRGAFFHSIHGTLNHELLADSIWMGRFEGTHFKFTSLDQELYASFDELKAQRVEMDKRIERWARGLTDTALNAKLTFTSAITKRTHAPTLWRVVLHFFNHQTHHRGQLTALLSQAGVDYGTTDLFLMPGLLDG